MPSSTDSVVIDAAGTYTVTSTTNVDVNSLVVDAGATLLGDPATLFKVEGDVVNNGIIEAGPFSGNHISTIDIVGNVDGTGSFEISNKAVLEIGGSVSGQLVNESFSGITVFFEAGQGELILDHSAQFKGLIASSAEGTPLSTGNLIDLKDLAFTSHMSATVHYDHNSNISTVTFSDSSTEVTLMFSGHDSNWNLTSDGHGGTIVADPPASGSATIESGTTLDISTASAESVSFLNDNGSTGTLVLQDSNHFTGLITGFTGDGTLSNSDSIDLKDVDFSKLTTETYVENTSGTGGTLTLSDGTHAANISFSGSYVFENFKFLSDDSGGTLVIDPPVASAQNQATSTPAVGFGPDSIPPNHIANVTALLAAANDDGHGNSFDPRGSTALNDLLKAHLAAHHSDFHFI